MARIFWHRFRPAIGRYRSSPPPLSSCDTPRDPTALQTLLWGGLLICLLGLIATAIALKQIPPSVITVGGVGAVWAYLFHKRHPGVRVVRPILAFL